MKHVRYHPEADQELTSTAVFYHNQAPGLGADFLDEVERTESFLIAFPHAGRPLRGGMRRHSVRRFPYDLIYEVEENALWILAVAHQRRRPGYWAGRTTR